MKENRKTIKSYIKIFIFLLFVIAISLAMWKFRHIFEFSFDDIDMSSNQDVRTSYNIYKVKINKVARDIYYVQFSDVICDGATDYDGTPHYFRIDITFETDNKETAENIYNYQKRVVETLRRITKDLKAIDRNSLKVMDYTKFHIRKSVEQITGKEQLKGIYFEGFLSQ